MAQIRNHGGNCCGARHIHSFRGNEAANVASLTHLTSSGGLAANHLLREVILSNRQTQSNPRLIAKLAELGYVYTSSWTGNHGTPVHRFERTGRRLALNRNGFNWQGMVASDTLDGDLNVLPVNEATPRNGIGLRDSDETLVYVGDLVRVTGGTSRYRGNAFTVIRFARNFNGQGLNRWRAVLRNDDGEQFRLVMGNLTRIGAGPRGRQAAPAIPEQVHTHNNLDGEGDRQQPVRVLFSTFHNNYRRNGRGAGFDTLEEATEAAPRCRRRDRRDIMSDGTVVWVYNVQ